MTKSRKNKMYWLEGVTEKEVVTALNDTRWNGLRRRPVRRVMVVGFSLLAALLMVTSIDFGVDVGLMSSVSFLVMSILLFVGYFALRTSVRQLADAPDELLDERQILIRNEVYLHAYRLTAILLVAAMIVALVGVSRWENLWFAASMVMAALPSMVLAWRLPNED